MSRARHSPLNLRRDTADRADDFGAVPRGDPSAKVDRPTVTFSRTAKGESLSDKLQSAQCAGLGLGEPVWFDSERGVRVLPLFLGLTALAISLVTIGAASADSDQTSESQGAESTGDDPTNPINRIELLNRFSEAYGRGVTPGTLQTVDTDLTILRLDSRINITPQWELGFRGELPYVAKNAVTPDNPTGQWESGIGNVLTQASLIRTFSEQWAAGVGAQIIAPTSTNGLASGKWEEVTGFAVRSMLPDISPGSYFAPQIRYATSFAGDPTGRNVRQLQFSPTLSVSLPENWYFTLYPSTDIRVNYGDPITGQTGRLFVPFDFLVGYRPTKQLVFSLELSVPIIKDFPLYTFKSQFRVGYLF